MTHSFVELPSYDNTTPRARGADLSNYLDKARVLILSNTSLSWSYTKNRAYADFYGVNPDNIIEFAFGTSTDLWTVSPAPANLAESMTALNGLMSLIKARLAATEISGILFGFGVPFKMTWHTYLQVTTVVVSSTEVWLPEVIATAKRWDMTKVILPKLPSVGAAPLPWQYRVSSTAYAELRGAGLKKWECGDHPEGNVSTEYDKYESYSRNVAYPPHQTPIQLLTEQIYSEADGFWHRYGYSRSNVLYVAKIGHTSQGYRPSPAGFTDDETSADTVLAKMEVAHTNYDRDVAQTLPLLLQLRAASGCRSSVFAGQAWLLDQWGYNIRYFYRQGEADTCATYAPKSGEIYDWVGGYRPVADPYYLMWGEGENTTEMYNSPYTECWQPLVGAVCHMGPSDGPMYNKQALKLGALSAYVDPGHYTTGIQGGARWRKIVLLLRGASLLSTSDYAAMASGDPLWEPFGDNLIIPYTPPVSPVGGIRSKRGFR